MQRQDKVRMNSFEKPRIFAIDYGSKRVGIAITDPLRMFAYPLTTIENSKKFWKELDKLIQEYQIDKIILGYPLKENGGRSSSTELVERFEQELKKKYKTEIIRVDERYSSSIAKERIIDSVTSKKKRKDKKLVDMNAAAVILQDYLEMGE